MTQLEVKRYFVKSFKNESEVNIEMSTYAIVAIVILSTLVIAVIIKVVKDKLEKRSEKLEK